MRLVHLSDLHIGKRVHEVSMIKDQEYILQQVIRIVDDEKPDVILICGDVYDKSIPSAEAVTLFDDFLYRLAKRHIPVLIISGNHDSPERLAFGNRLMEHAGIHISSAYDGNAQCVTLSDDHGTVDFWLLPFVKPAHVMHHYPDENIISYTDAVRVAVEKMAVDTTKRNVLLTHQFVTGATTCESEELSIGGSDSVDAAVFEDFDYVALGHIHGQQNIGGSNRIRYCGTPLKYSFSEEHHHKSVTVVDIGTKGSLQLHLRPLIPQHDLRTIRGTFAELTNKTFYGTMATEDYLHAVLTDEEDIPEAIGKLHVIYPNIMKLSYDNTRTKANQSIDSAELVEQKTPLQLFEELFELQNNHTMSNEQRAFALQLIQSIQEDNA